MSIDLDENPFDRLQVDPRLSPQELTELLRRRAERAMPAERKRLQSQWRELTLKDDDRVRLAFLAHPRRGRQSAREIEELRRKVPPFLGRHKPAAARLLAGDALALPEQQGTDAVAPIRPPSMLGREDPNG